MKQEICSLCGKAGKLAESHIIPKFVFRWMKETGGNYFRNPLTPNRRMQDGIKKHLLCKDCELNFSKSEKWFAENIFYPHINERAKFLDYDNRLSKFIISVLWRYLLFCKSNNENYNEEVFNDWQSYLINNTKPKYDNIHLMLLPDEWGIDGQPNKYVNRYFYRVSDMNVIKNSNTEIIYAKFSRFIIFLDVNKTEDYFRGTNISFENGTIPFAQFISDNSITKYFVDRAEDVYNLTFSRISQKEKEKIQKVLLNNQTEFFKSDLGKTIYKDLNSKIIPFSFKSGMNYVCDCCLKSMEEPEGYLLRTYEIIQSIDYWKFVFKRNRLSIKGEDLNKRVEYFTKIASSQTPWVICDDCISKFKIDLNLSKAFMVEWITKKGKFFPPKCDDAKKYLTSKNIEEIGIMIVSVESK